MVHYKQKIKVFNHSSREVFKISHSPHTPLPTHKHTPLIGTIRKIEKFLFVFYPLPPLRYTWLYIIYIINNLINVKSKVRKFSFFQKSLLSLLNHLWVGKISIIIQTDLFWRLPFVIMHAYNIWLSHTMDYYLHFDFKE